MKWGAAKRNDHRLDVRVRMRIGDEGDMGTSKNAIFAHRRFRIGLTIC